MSGNDTTEPAAVRLVAENVSKSYPTRSGDLAVLCDVSLELTAGAPAAIIGPSGSGKSTLLNILGGLDRPTSGHVLLNGCDLSTLADNDLAAVRNRKIGFVFQDHHLLPQCTARENVLIPTLAFAGAGEEEVRRAARLLGRVGLADRGEHTPAELSGGERQRVAIARALINQPAVILADEPTGNLDRASATTVADLLIELCREQNAILLVVTHSLELADRLPVHFELHNGRLQ